MFLCIYHKNSFENLKQMSKSGFSYSDHMLVWIQDFQAKLGESRQDWDGWTI